MTQRRTPPALKLLLNERAAALGELDVATKACNRARRNIARAEAAVQAARQKMAAAEVCRDQSKAMVDALDLTVRSMYRGAHPDAAGMVRAWAGKYGKRGDFTQFALAKVREAAPQSVTTSEVAKAAAVEFGLTITTTRERNQLRNSVRKRLWDAAAAGLVERVPTANAAAGLWRWREAPTGRELLLLAAAAATERSHDEEPHTAGGEVGGHRTGSSHG